MTPQQIQSDLVSIRRGVGTALAFLVAGLFLLGLYAFTDNGDEGNVAAGLAVLFFVLTGLQLWQCRHEVNRLSRLLDP
jgi:hypothetical protein